MIGATRKPNNEHIMNEKIYLIDGDQQLREMEAQDYDGEDL